jgi:hypothetical protein
MIRTVGLAILILGTALFFWNRVDMHSSPGRGRIALVAIGTLLLLVECWFIWPGLWDAVRFWR